MLSTQGLYNLSIIFFYMWTWTAAKCPPPLHKTKMLPRIVLLKEAPNAELHCNPGTQVSIRFPLFSGDVSGVWSWFVSFFPQRTKMRMNSIQMLGLTLLCALSASAQVIMPGRCPDAAVQEKFDAAAVRSHLCSVGTKAGWRSRLTCFCFSLQYLGKWYEIQKLPNSFQKGQCSTAQYSLQSPGVVGVLNRELLWASCQKKSLIGWKSQNVSNLKCFLSFRNNGTIYALNGTAKPSPTEPAKLMVTFFESKQPVSSVVFIPNSWSVVVL